MRVILSTLLLLYTASLVSAQCDQTVWDQAGVMTARINDVDQAAQQLKQLGVDVRIRTIAHSTNLDQVEHEMEKACPSWQGGMGGRKSTLLVLMVAPNDHKLGVYYGAAWRRAFDNHWNRIKQEVMGPRFHDKDFAGGFIAGENEFAARIKSSQNEAITPVVSTTTVNQQATDFSGLWMFLEVSAVVVFFIIGCILLLSVFSKKRKEKQAIDEAQQRAINARNSAMSRARNAVNANALEEYAAMSNLARNDPTENGRSLAEYKLMEEGYNQVAQSPSSHNPFIDTPKAKAGRKPKKDPTEDLPHESVQSNVTTPQPSVVRETVIERDNSSGIDGFVAGAVLGELSRNDEYRREEEREDERRQKQDNRVSTETRDVYSSPSSSGGDDDSSSGGGSSDYGSSGSDSGGSSDYSSDSGGGGSSDF